MQIPIQYFQVTAAAIPTLLIAVAFTAKFSSTKAHFVTTSGKLNWAATSLALIAALLTLTGEAASLLALITAAATTGQVGLPLAAISSLLLILMMIFLEPLLESVGKLPGNLIRLALALLSCLPSALLLLYKNWEGGLGTPLLL